MPDESLFQNIGIDLRTMSILLKSRATKAALGLEEFITLAVENGVDRRGLRDVLIQDLREGGRIFGDFRRQINATANGVVKRASDTGSFSVLEEIKTYRWVAVGDGNVCPQCVDRHGKEKTMEEWERIGLPATGTTYCKENCRCVLVPAKIIKLDPISLKEVK